MGNALVKAVGIIWMIIGLLMMVIGQNLYYDQETWPYSDTGNTIYHVGIALVILSIIVFILGLLSRPSLSEILKAERLVGANLDRLLEFRGGQDSIDQDSMGSTWDESQVR